MNGETVNRRDTDIAASSFLCPGCGETNAPDRTPSGSCVSMCQILVNYWTRLRGAAA